MEKGNLKLRPTFNMRDAGQFYNDVVLNWKPSSEVWAFKHGDDILSAAGGLTSFYLTYFFRKHLKLRYYSKLTCYMPTMGLSSIACYFFQVGVVNPSVLGSTCPTCVYAKSASLQLTLGLLYPLVIAPLITFHVADRLMTYPVPPLMRAPREVFHLWLRFVSMIPRPIYASAATQLFLTLLITNQKMAFFNRHFR